MPAFLESKLKRRYGASSSVPYKIMNALGYMHGNKETAKGRAVQHKHDKDYGKAHAALEHRYPSKRG